jgi:hypothetical protein
MIEGRELRIANCVYLTLGFEVDEIVRMKTITENKVKVFGYGIEYSLEQLNPIPITPELIDSIKPNLSHGGYTHKWTTSGRLEIQLSYSYITTVETLHEYQNLYYALTGAELNYNI